MLIEAKAAFYNEATGAVQPWRDIEVTDTVGGGLIGEGLAVEIAEGGGGGGSDFTTAQVTITPGSDLTFRAIVPYVYDDGEYAGSIGDLYMETAGTINVILYKGETYMNMYSSVITSSISVTGDITLVPDVLDPQKTKQFVITGDCTITLSE